MNSEETRQDRLRRSNAICATCRYDYSKTKEAVFNPRDRRLIEIDGETFLVVTQIENQTFFQQLHHNRELASWLIRQHNKNWQYMGQDGYVYVYRLRHPYPE